MEGTMVWLAGTLAVSLIANMGQMAVALIKRPAVTVGMIEGKIALHEVNCSNLEAIMKILTEIRNDMRAHQQWHLEQASMKRRSTD